MNRFIAFLVGVALLLPGCAEARHLKVLRRTDGIAPPPAGLVANIGVKTTGGAGGILTGYTGGGTLTVSGTDATLYQIDTGGGASRLVPTYPGSYTAGNAPGNQPLIGKTVNTTSSLTLTDGLGFSEPVTITYKPGFTIAPDSRDDAGGGTFTTGGFDGAQVQLVQAIYDATFDDNITLRSGCYNCTPVYSGSGSRTWWIATGTGAADPSFTSGSTVGVPASFHWINIVPEVANGATIGSFQMAGATTSSGGLAIEMQAYLHFAPTLQWNYPGGNGRDVSATFMLQGSGHVASVWVDTNTFISNASDSNCTGPVSPSCVDASTNGNVFSAIFIPSGNRASYDTPAQNNIYITNNHILGVYTGINLSATNGAFVIGNDVEQSWEDSLHISQSDNLLVQWNYLHNRRSGPAHGDYAQLPWTGVIVQAYGPTSYLDNVAYVGRGGGNGTGAGEDDGNHFLWSGTPSGVTFSAVTYRGNTVIDENANGMGPNALTTASFIYNAWVRDQSGQATVSAANPVAVFYGPDGTNANVKFQCNVTMSVSPFYVLSGGASDPAPVETANGVQSNINLQATGYGAAFNGTLPASKPSVGPTLAQIQAIITPKSGGVLDTLNTAGGCKPGPGAGTALGVDYVNRIDNLPAITP